MKALTIYEQVRRNILDLCLAACWTAINYNNLVAGFMALLA